MRIALRWALLPDVGGRALAVVVFLIPVFAAGVPDVLTGALAVWLTRPAIRVRLPLSAVFLVLIAARMYWFGDADIRAWEDVLSWRGAGWGYVLRLFGPGATFLVLARLVVTMDRRAPRR